jgi:hypothetical protein
MFTLESEGIFVVFTKDRSCCLLRVIQIQALLLAIGWKIGVRIPAEYFSFPCTPRKTWFWGVTCHSVGTEALFLVAEWSSCEAYPLTSV